MHLTKSCGLRLTANWNSGKGRATYRHAKWSELRLMQVDI